MAILETKALSYGNFHIPAKRAENWQFSLHFKRAIKEKCDIQQCNNEIFLFFHFINLITNYYYLNLDSSQGHKVSPLGVDSLWGDCAFIPADWGS